MTENIFIFPFSGIEDINSVLSDEIIPFDSFNKLEAFQCDDNPLSRFNNDDVDINISQYNNIRCDYTDLEGVKQLTKFNKLSLFFLNINSLPKHLDTLSSHLLSDSHSPKILGFCETKLSPEIENIYNIPGYSSIFNSKSTRSGGLALYLKSEISFEVIDEFNFLLDFIESICIKIKIDGQDIVLCLLYRRPSSDLNQFLIHYSSIIDKFKNDKCIIFGDLNLDLLKYDSCSNVQNFVNINFEKHFFPAINKPTRVTNHSATVIDHIWFNSIDDNELNNRIVLSDISDHFGIFLGIFDNVESEEPLKEFSYRDYKKLEDGSFYNAIQNKLEIISFDSIHDVDSALQKLVDMISNVIDEVFPIKTIKPKHKPNPWITDEIKKLIKEKNKLYNKFCRRPITFGPQYRSCRNRLNNLIKSTKRRYFRSKLHNSMSDSKKTWNILNELLGRNTKSKHNLSRINDGVGITTDGERIASILNSHFVNTPNIIADSIRNQQRPDFHEFLSGNFPQSFYLCPLTSSNICEIVSQLKNTSSGGHLDIPSKVVKCIINLIADILSKIFNKCISDGYFPDILKIAQVTPVYKSGSRLLPSNYRPISVLNIISKILEKHIYKELLSYLELNNILCEQQCGFRIGISTNVAIGKLLNKITSGLEDNKYGVGVFLDLQKAFDMVDRNILLNKLTHYGIRGIPNNLIKSFLSGRKQYVKLGDSQSNTSETTLGTPQGSILSPLLFLIFINDIINCSNILHFHLFADDTCVYLNDANLVSLYTILNVELCKIGRWITANSLSLNVSKSVYLLFSGRKPISSIPPLILMGQTILRQPHTKFLGLTIDENLSWILHINYVKGRISRMIGILYKIRSLLTSNALKTIYYSLVYPYLQYGIVFWGGACNTHLNKLFVSQKKIVRIITNSPYRAHTNALFLNQSLLKLDDIKKLEMSKFIYSDLNTHNNLNLRTRNAIHSYNTRNNSALNLPQARTDLYTRSVFYEGLKIYNSLDPEIQESTSLPTFKIKLKKHLISNYNNNT